jgi:hypothetical protein
MRRLPGRTYDPPATEIVCKRVCTPKALNNLAQGNTLGKRTTCTYPERVEYDFRGFGSLISLFQSDESLIVPCPRVLPWAKLFNAFGVRIRVFT